MVDSSAVFPKKISNMKLIFAARPSTLARWQTQWVISALQSAHPDLLCEERIITTQGDKILDKHLPEVGGKGFFTQELEAELLSSRVDCAVHSFKDLPIENPAELTVGCTHLRADVRDVLISERGYSLETLPPASIVGTSSLRRAAQALSARPDLTITSLRGNVDTRLRKALEGQYDAIILAAAGLARLGLEKHVTEWLSLDVMLPAPGQGALAVQCRVDDQKTLNLLAALEDDSTTRIAVTAERAFLSGLGGGCSVPVAAYATVNINQSSVISLTGLVISVDATSVALPIFRALALCDVNAEEGEPGQLAVTVKDRVDIIVNGSSFAEIFKPDRLARSNHLFHTRLLFGSHFRRQEIKVIHADHFLNIPVKALRYGLVRRQDDACGIRQKGRFRIGVDQSMPHGLAVPEFFFPLPQRRSHLLRQDKRPLTGAFLPLGEEKGKQADDRPGCENAP